jgi:6-phosphogluconolactonase (cycloisomerase 2 family)
VTGVLASAVASLAIGGAALAATGDLTPLGCIDDVDNGPDACAQAADGLDGAVAVAVSPDGRSVYTASQFDDAIARFDRDPATGLLTPQGCVEDDDSANNACSQDGPGLTAVQGLAVSPDGTSLYAVGTDDNAIVRFSRDPNTGAITPVDCIEDAPGVGECATDEPGLTAPRSVAVSPEGNSVYVASLGDSAVTRFNRNTGTGELDFAFCFEDANTGSGDCSGPDGTTTQALDQAISVTVSPDGASMYAASAGDDAIVRFNRNPADGFITPQGCVDDNDAGQGPDACGQSTDGLDNAQAVTVSPDNLSVYAGSRDDDAVVRFDRASDGGLTPRGCVDDNDTGPDTCVQSTDGLGDVFSVAVSPDNLSLYAAGRADDAVVVFDRSPNPGELTPRGCIDDNDPPFGADNCAQSTDGMRFVQSVAVSPDGTSVYGSSDVDLAVVMFAREVPSVGTADTDPPETTITKAPKKKTKKRQAKFKFTSDEPGSTFQCKLNKRQFLSCLDRVRYKVKRKKHKFQVRAIDPAGNVDPTPAKRKWKVKKAKKKKKT